MFIRETTKKAKGKKKYCQHQLIESVRTPAGPRQNIILNLGHLELPKEYWKELANTIESFLLNQASLFFSNPEIESKARHYAEIIRKQRLSQEKEIKIENNHTKKQIETVVIDSLTHNESRTIGAEHVAISQMNEYGFDDILASCGFNESQIMYAKMLLVARMIHPASERETVRWLQETSGLLELLQAENLKVYDMALHRVSVLLFENREFIEKRLREKAREVFSLQEAIILYDLTNTYFEGSKKGSAIAKHGRSKEKRNDCPIVTLALTVDAEGFPKQSKIWEGNVSEPGTLESILEGLEKERDPLFGKEKTIVFDAGIATEDNLSLIKEKKHYYIAVSRKGSYEDSFWQQAQEKNIKLADNKTTLKMKLIKSEEEVFLLCHSEAKQKKEESIFSRKKKKFEEALCALSDGLKKKNTQKKYEHIIERIGRLKERYGIGHCYTIKVDQKDRKAIAIHFQCNDQSFLKEKAIGHYVLRTNRMDLNAEEISKIHRALTTVEDCFKQMKGALGLRPNFHHTDTPTIAHINISVLAYHVLAPTLKKLRTVNIQYSWQSIRNILATHTRVTTTMNTEDDHVLDIRTCTAANEKQQLLYRKLNIKQIPLPRISLKTPLKIQRCSVENITPKIASTSN